MDKQLGDSACGEVCRAESFSQHNMRRIELESRTKSKQEAW